MDTFSRFTDRSDGLKMRYRKELRKFKGFIVKKLPKKLMLWVRICLVPLMLVWVILDGLKEKKKNRSVSMRLRTWDSTIYASKLTTGLWRRLNCDVDTHALYGPLLSDFYGGLLGLELGRVKRSSSNNYHVFYLTLRDYSLSYWILARFLCGDDFKRVWLDSYRPRASQMVLFGQKRRL